VPKFKKSTLFKTTFEQRNPALLAIFEQPAPCKKHPLLLDFVVAHAYPLLDHVSGVYFRV
jgi:hypothetical protein